MPQITLTFFIFSLWYSLIGAWAVDNFGCLPSAHMPPSSVSTSPFPLVLHWVPKKVTPFMALRVNHVTQSKPISILYSCLLATVNLRNFPGNGRTKGLSRSSEHGSSGREFSPVLLRFYMPCKQRHWLPLFCITFSRKYWLLLLLKVIKCSSSQTQESQVFGYHTWNCGRWTCQLANEAKSQMLYSSQWLAHSHLEDVALTWSGHYGIQNMDRN